MATASTGAGRPCAGASGAAWASAILAGIIFAGAGLVRQQYGDSLDALEALPVAAGGLALVILVLALALRRR